MQQALSMLSKLPQQADAERIAGSLQGSLDKASAMQASLHTSLDSSSAGR